MAVTQSCLMILQSLVRQIIIFCHGRCFMSRTLLLCCLPVFFVQLVGEPFRCDLSLKHLLLDANIGFFDPPEDNYACQFLQAMHLERQKFGITENCTLK